MVTELCTGGELFDQIIDDNYILTEQDIAGIFKNVLSGVAFFHNKNIMHRDIKPENLLLESKGG